MHALEDGLPWCPKKKYDFKWQLIITIIFINRLIFLIFRTMFLTVITGLFNLVKTKCQKGAHIFFFFGGGNVKILNLPICRTLKKIKFGTLFDTIARRFNRVETKFSESGPHFTCEGGRSLNYFHLPYGFYKMLNIIS